MALSPADPSLPSPSIAPRILKTVSEALYCGRKLEIAYEPTFGSTETLVVSPLGLVHGELPYLVCRPDMSGDLRRIELLRIRDARMLDVPVTNDEGFSVSAYLRENATDRSNRSPP